jgi:hypothetical protein
MPTWTDPTGHTLRIGMTVEWHARPHVVFTGWIEAADPATGHPVVLACQHYGLNRQVVPPAQLHRAAIQGHR